MAGLFARILAHNAQGVAYAMANRANSQQAQGDPRAQKGGKEKEGCVPCQARGAIYETQKRLGVQSWYGK